MMETSRACVFVNGYPGLVGDFAILNFLFDIGDTSRTYRGRGP